MAKANPWSISGVGHGFWSISGNEGMDWGHLGPFLGVLGMHFGPFRASFEASGHGLGSFRDSSGGSGHGLGPLRSYFNLISLKQNNFR